MSGLCVEFTFVTTNKNGQKRSGHVRPYLCLLTRYFNKHLRVKLVVVSGQNLYICLSHDKVPEGPKNGVVWLLPC